MTTSSTRWSSSTSGRFSSVPSDTMPLSGRGEIETNPITLIDVSLPSFRALGRLGVEGGPREQQHREEVREREVVLGLAEGDVEVPGVAQGGLQAQRREDRGEQREEIDREQRQHAGALTQRVEPQQEAQQ